MDDTCPANSTDPAIALPGARWSDLRWLLLLLALAAGLRGWQVARAELASRDSVAYIRQAWRFEHEPWSEVIRTSPHHPVYAVLVYLMAKPVRAVVDNLPRAMQLAAQLASSLASVLLVVPMYYLGRELFDRRVGFWAALLVQVLPSTGRMLPDGLSEGPFLLLAATALLFAALGLRTGGVRWFVLTGLTTGLAYLTRTEGLLVTAVTGMVLLGLQRSVRWRQPWATTGRNAAALAAGCAVVAVPFMLLIGGVSLKASYRYMIDPEGWKLPPRVELPAVAAPLPLALWNYGPDVLPRDRYGWAAWAVLQVLDDSFFHLGLPLAVLGLWLFRRGFADAPGRWLVVVLGLVLLPLLYKLGQSNGYLGERHAVLLVLGGVYFAVAAVGAVAAWLAARQPRLSAPAAGLVLMGAWTAVCVPKAVAPLHANRAGFREAGEWLAQHSEPGDPVVDPMAWTSYHAGRLFVEGRSDVARSSPPVSYVVLERSNSTHSHLYYLIGPAEELAKRGEVCYRQSVRRGKAKAEIVIYRVPHPGGVRTARGE
ncbi:MAG: glycosyltransferase family 39 protein [Gemmataceae bacterium]